MVNLDVTKGSQLVDALEGAKLKIGVALWVVLAEYEDWRLIISARQLDALDFRAAYRLVYDALAPAGFTPRNTPPIMILPMADPFIKQVRRLFGKSRSVEGMNIGLQLIGDRFVEDGYLYRIS